jgi:hypothetical protein
VVDKLKVGVYQSKNDYPELHLIITSNPRFLKDRLTRTSIKETLAIVKEWLTRNLK